MDYDLAVNDIKIDPATQHLPDGLKTLWIATDGGLFVSNDGGDSWTEKGPASVSNPEGDSPAPTAGELRFTRLLFAGDDGRLFAIANWTNGEGIERSWLFYTDEADLVRSDETATVSWSEV